MGSERQTVLNPAIQSIPSLPEVLPAPPSRAAELLKPGPPAGVSH